MDAEEVPRSAPSLSVEPHGIDFGCLKPGEGANATLRVSGGPSQAIVHNDRLRITPSKFGSENIEVQLTLLGGSAGELIWDDIVLQGDNGELKVLVTARWGIATGYEREVKPVTEPEPVPMREPMPPKPLSGRKEKEIQETEPGVSESEIEKRTFRGRTCRWCGKNIHYDSDSQSWKPCKTCRGAHIPIFVLLRISKEFHLGLKEVHASMAEIWDTLLGKEEKRR